MLKEMNIFGAGILSGVILAAIFDLGRAFRKKIPHKNIWVSLEDLLFWMFAGVFLFALFEKYNKGVLRFYIFLGVGIGGLLYCLLLHKPAFFCFSIFFQIVKVIFDLVGKIMGKIKMFVKKMIILPLKNVIKEITIMLNNV